MSPNGVIESTLSDFITSWKTSILCRESKQYQQTAALEVHPCDVFTSLAASAEKRCNILNSKLFENCHQAVDVNNFIDKCESEFCNSQQMPCSIISDYVRECKKSGVEIANWRTSTNCELACPGLLEYSECGQEQTCKQVNSNEMIGSAVCQEGCFCPEGFYLAHDSESCVRIEDCSCEFDGNLYASGENRIDGCDICSCDKGSWKCKQHKNCVNGQICPAQEIWTECKPIHEESCDVIYHEQVETVSENCVAGCVCKKGLVRNAEGDCVAQNTCPCLHNEVTFAAGESTTINCQECICKGKSWSCSGSFCQQQCSIYGEGHFKSFDGKEFSFNGECQYIMARNDDITILVDMQPCGTAGVTCAKGVKILHNSNPKMALSMDENKCSEDMIKDAVVAGFTIKAPVPDLYVIDTTFGLTVEYDGSSLVKIFSNSGMSSNLSGLCGNANGDPRDDFKGPFGGPAEQLANVFADRWRLFSYCPEALNPQVTNSTCQIHPERQPWAHRRCSIIKSEIFQKCHQMIPVQAFFDNCVEDACGCNTGGDCECICTAIKAYADECSRAGIQIDWRTNDFCPMQCDCPSKRNTCVSHNVRTCQHKNKVTLDANDVCVEGCACEEGTIFDELYQRCVPERMCSCIYDNEIYFDGDQVVSDKIECQTCFCNAGVVECIGVPGCEVSTAAPESPVSTAAPETEDETVSTAQPEVTVTAKPVESTCKTGWTSWMNSNYPTFKNSGDFENHKTLRKQHEYCQADKIVSIECQPVNGYMTKATMKDITCDVQKGLICYNQGEKLCLDFEVRFYCECGEDETDDGTTEGSVVTAAPGSVVTTAPDGSVVTSKPDSSVVTDKPGQTPEASVVTTKPDQTPEGIIVTAKPGQTPEGSVSTAAPGSEETTAPTCNKGWTEWFNNGNPSDKSTDGDYETISYLQKFVKPCGNYSIEDIQCGYQSGKSGNMLDYLSAQQKGVTCDLNRGLSCINSLQKGTCLDYSVKVLCLCGETVTPTGEETTPEGSIVTVITRTPTPEGSIVTAAPGTTPDASVVTGTPSNVTDDGDTTILTVATGPSGTPIITPIKTATPEQSVVTATPEEFPDVTPVVVDRHCTHGWTNWFNEKTSDLGDFQRYKDLDHAGQIPCETPTNIQCRVAGTTDDYIHSGQDVVCEPLRGLICYNDKNSEPCLDYEVRFYCECTQFNDENDDGVTDEDDVRMNNFCPIGIESHLIQDEQISVTSHLENFNIDDVRLNSNSAWVAKNKNKNQYIEINFGQIVDLTGIITQGDSNSAAYVSEYKLMYSQNGKSYKSIFVINDTDKTNKIFPANSDANTQHINLFHKVTAQYLRIKPCDWHENIAMRVEILTDTCEEGPVSTGSPSGDTTTTSVCDMGEYFENCKYIQNTCYDVCHKDKAETCEDQCIPGCVKFADVGNSDYVPVPVCAGSNKVMSSTGTCISKMDCGCKISDTETLLPAQSKDITDKKNCTCFNNELICETVTDSSVIVITSSPEEEVDETSTGSVIKGEIFGLTLVFWECVFGVAPLKL